MGGSRNLEFFFPVQFSRNSKSAKKGDKTFLNNNPPLPDNSILLPPQKIDRKSATISVVKHTFY